MASLYYPEGFFVTTLSADINATTTTIPLVAVPSRVTAGYMVIEPDSATKREVIHFTSVGVSSVTAADDTTDASDASGRGALGSITQGGVTTHSQGASVIIAATEQYWDRLYDKLTGSDSDGVQLVEINDTNGNEQIKFVTTASAVNEVTMTNAATGNAPKVEATGGDTNIDLKLLSKGTGALTVSGTTDYETNVTDDDDIPNKKYVDDLGSTDGYISSADTWVYVSASSFKIEGVDRTSVYTKGTRLKLTQTTAKYAVVVSSSFSTDTTINIAVNTDYTIANAAITSPYYSYQLNPQGYPDWFATAAPTFVVTTIDNAAAGQPTTAETRIRVTGRQCEIHWKGNGTKAGTDPYIRFAKSGFPTVANSSNGSAYGVMWIYNQTDDVNYGGVVGDEDGTNFYAAMSTNQTDNDTLLRCGFKIAYEI